MPPSPPRHLGAPLGQSRGSFRAAVALLPLTPGFDRILTTLSVNA